MKQVFSAAVALGILITTSGCVFSNAKLDLRYDEAIAKIGPLAECDSVNIKIEKFKDSRQVRDRIGDKRNGYGWDCADVVTVSPVCDIFQDGLAAMFRKNGHTITDEKPAVVVTGVVETFWFEQQVNFWTIQFMGTADLMLELKDAKSGETLHSKRYSGHSNIHFIAAYEKEMRDVMNKAVEDLIANISIDPALLEAMQPYAGKARNDQSI